MTMWILMFYIGFQNGGVVAEFTTKEKCEFAAKEYIKISGARPYSYICVQK